VTTTPTTEAIHAFVYSGPHYGRKHVVGRRNRHSNLVEVVYRGDRFSVPYTDIECSWCDTCSQAMEQGAIDCPRCKEFKARGGPEQEAA
jgi:hypothetical protein